MRLLARGALRSRSITLGLSGLVSRHSSSSVVSFPNNPYAVIAFDAHVLKWTLDDSPPDEHARHHIKEASFYGQDTWTVDLTIKLPTAPLNVDFIGIGEKRMWPGKKAEKEEGGRAMVLFEKFDKYVEESTNGTVDVMLLGCLGGQTAI